MDATQAQGAEDALEIPENSLFSHAQIRKGQLGFYRDAKQAAREGRVLFANAPTGIGKTAAALAGVLEEAIPAGRKVLFLTNRNSHHIQAIIESKAIEKVRKAQLARLRPGKPRILAVDKIGKDRMCLRLYGKSERPPFLLCEIAHCKYQEAKKEHVDMLLQTQMSAKEASEIGHEKGFCAHQVALAASAEADLVVCDYSYLFDSGIREIVLAKMKTTLANCDVIIDEAHNLPDRVRAIGEEAIDEKTMKNAIRGVSQIRRMAAEGEAQFVVQECDALSHHMRTVLSPGISTAVDRHAGNAENRLGDSEIAFIGKKIGQSTLLGGKIGAEGGVEKTVAERIDFVCGFFLEAMAKGRGDEEFAGVMALRQLSGFLKASGEAARGNRRWGVFARRGELRGMFEMKTSLFDPSEISAYVFGEAHSCVLMSGTLIGKEALRGLLGISGKKSMGLEMGQYESPFDDARQPIAICTAASSRLKARSDDEKMQQMAWIINEAAEACRPHSLAIFYPSYEYMEMLSERVRLPGYSSEKEERKEGHARVEARKGRLEGHGDKAKPLALHGVVGGAYYEGMDFRNNPFKLIILAGYPYPKVSPPHKAYEEFLSQKFNNEDMGRKYASVLPASVRALQCIGRGIRKAEDWCYCLMIDDRFTANMEFLPQAMVERMRKVQPDMVSDEITQFMKKMDGE